MLKRTEIRIRDPFILTDKASGKYYMYGTTALNGKYDTGTTFSVYESRDLENFSEPITVFDGKDFWADADYWAPEVYFYRGRYYMFASFRSEKRTRGTQVLVSDSPKGLFKPISDGPVTPENWSCLDGTLYVENGVPYMVFCREWTEVFDGRIYAMKLSDDLTRAASEPKLLFSASENAYTTPFSDGNGKKCYVTDGPFLYSDGRGAVMLWSSVHDKTYCVLKARADFITGKWTQDKNPVFSADGGHCMIFTDFSGRKKIAMHKPNFCPEERAFFTDFNEDS